MGGWVGEGTGVLSSPVTLEMPVRCPSAQGLGCRIGPSAAQRCESGRQVTVRPQGNAGSRGENKGSRTTTKEIERSAQ